MIDKIPAVLGLAAAVALAACSGASGSGERVQASGQQGQRAFQLAGFDRVALEGPDDVAVRVGPAFSVMAQGDTGVMQALDVRVDDGTLKIGRQRASRYDWGGVDSGSEVRFVVTLPALRGASLAGAGDMRIDRVADGDFTAGLAGAGDMAIGQLAVRAFEVNIAGAGDLSVAGTADRLSVSLVGAGDVDAPGLTARAAKVSILGAGDVRATVDGPAEVSIMGAGDVDLGPRARCTSSRMGAGTVRCGS